MEDLGGELCINTLTVHLCWIVNVSKKVKKTPLRKTLPETGSILFLILSSIC